MKPTSSATLPPSSLRQFLAYTASTSRPQPQTLAVILYCTFVSFSCFLVSQPALAVMMLMLSASQGLGFSCTVRQ